MSGIEVSASFTKLVAGFRTAEALISSFRKTRDARQHNKDNRTVELALYFARSRVQSVYDDSYARLGAKFAKGDGAYLIPLLAQNPISKPPCESALSPLTRSAYRNLPESSGGAGHLVARYHHRPTYSCSGPGPHHHRSSQRGADSQ